MKNYYIVKFLKDLNILSKNDLDLNYFVKPFQKPHLQQNNIFTRIDKIKEGFNET